MCQFLVPKRGFAPPKGDPRGGAKFLLRGAVAPPPQDPQTTCLLTVKKLCFPYTQFIYIKNCCLIAWITSPCGFIICHLVSKLLCRLVIVFNFLLSVFCNCKWFIFYPILVICFILINKLVTLFFVKFRPYPTST